jgi:hypothetical protein
MLLTCGRGVIQPAFFLAIVAPIIVNSVVHRLIRDIAFVYSQAGQTSDPTYLFVTNPRFAPCANFVVQVFAALISAILWLVASWPLRAALLHKAQRSGNGVAEPKGVGVCKPLYILLSVGLFLWCLFELVVGWIGTKETLELYMKPPTRFWGIPIPPLNSRLTWVRFAIAAMSLFLMYIQSKEPSSQINAGGTDAYGGNESVDAASRVHRQSVDR